MCGRVMGLGSALCSSCKARADERHKQYDSSVRDKRSTAFYIWSFVNAQAVANSFGEIKVDKEQGKRNKRIDPVDAAIDAHLIAMKPATHIDLDDSIGKFMDLMR